MPRQYRQPERIRILRQINPNIPNSPPGHGINKLLHSPNIVECRVPTIFNPLSLQFCIETQSRVFEPQAAGVEIILRVVVAIVRVFLAGFVHRQSLAAAIIAVLREIVKATG
ncbi:MAG TPA: hypothetical protein DCY88_28320 [Cyanobacteria bacterium UBA11372]|nr:hypothetical protein [Cyanobacteria bacterium UBA11372]HBE53972.1 hypothetical protein [Cyanobacteria bacterium UBA11369]